MRRYTDDAMETLRTRRFLSEWKAEGLLTEAQYQQLEQENVSDLRTTNLFLRLVLFFFTTLCAAAAAALFFDIVRPPHPADGTLLILFAALGYSAAEFSVHEFRFYRYGIEEALAVCSIGFLYAGLQLSMGPSATNPRGAESVIFATSAVFSLWVWHRFGLWYVFLIAMIFAVFVPTGWTSSPTAQHIIPAALYGAGLIPLTLLRRRYRRTSLDPMYSLAEAFLWLGLYLTLNLQVFALDSPARWLFGNTQDASVFGRPFYWLTWLLIWCLPAVILARGIRYKDRFVIAAGALAAVLTLVTNKPYLGWPRHTWDPMLLGILLTFAAFYLRRWLQQGPAETRHGFTADRLSKKDSRWAQSGASALGFLSPHAIIPAPQTSGTDLGLEGGTSGGAGASRDF